MRNRLKLDLMAIATIPLIMTLGNSMLLPILPDIAKKLHITSFEVSMLITVYSVIAIILIPIAGFLSDRYGRKTVIVPSLFITAIGGLIAGLAAWFLEDKLAYWIILVGRFLQGVGAAGAFPIVLPLVGDLFKTDEAVSQGLGIIETSNTSGKVLSPIIGTLLAAFVWFLPFLAIPVFCLISLILVLFFVKTPKSKSGSSKKQQTIRLFLQDVKDILKAQGRWLYTIFIIGCIVMFVLFGILFYLSSMLEDRYQIHGLKKGLILAIPLAILCLASFTAGKWIGNHKNRMKWLAFIGMAIAACSIVTMTWSANLYLMLGILIINGVGLGATLPCLDALLTEGIGKKQRGTISSLYSSMRFIGVALGPPVIALLITRKPFLMFGILSAACVIAALLMLMFVHTHDYKAQEHLKRG
jgi:ACDE family multidrug resistance protein